jgi:hypothetical protein
MLVMEMNSNDIMKLLEEKAEKNEESFYWGFIWLNLDFVIDVVN